MIMKKLFGFVLALTIGAAFASCELGKDILTQSKAGIPYVNLAKPTNGSQVNSNFIVSASAYDLGGIDQRRYRKDDGYTDHPRRSIIFLL